jgi:hypothetical protein
MRSGGGRNGATLFAALCIIFSIDQLSRRNITCYVKMRRAGASSSTGDADSLQTFIRRAATQVQRWNNAAREYEKKAKRSKQLALESGVILAELSGLDDSNADDIATARRLVQKLETADLIEPKDAMPIEESDDMRGKFFENTQAEEKAKHDISAVNKKRKRESEPRMTNISGITKIDEMDIVIEPDEAASLAGHDDQMMLESTPSNIPPIQPTNRTPSKPQRPPPSPKRGGAVSSAPAAPIDSEIHHASPPPAKKAKNTDPVAPAPTEAAPAKKSAAVDASPAAKKAASTLKAVAGAKKTAAPREPPGVAAPVVVQRGMFDTFADRKSVRTLRGRDSTLQACHKQKPRCIAFSPTVQDTLATSALDGTICFWNKRDNATGNEKKCEEVGYLDRAKLRHSRFPADMCWHDSGNRLAVLFSSEHDDGAPIVTKDDKVENAQMIIFNTQQLPNVPAFFLPNKPHKKDPKRYDGFHLIFFARC